MLRILLLGILSVVSANIYATTLLDNSSAALVFADDLRSANRGGISFTVGSAGYQLSTIQFVPVKQSSSGDALGDITIGLYPWDPSTNTISGPAVVSQTFTGLLFKDLSSASWSNNVTVSFTSSATLSPNTSYILVFGPSSISGVVSGIATAGVAVSAGSSGLTLLYGNGYSTDSGSSWTTSGDLLVSIAGNPLSAVPTLSEWTQILLGLMVITLIGWHFHNTRETTL